MRGTQYTLSNTWILACHSSGRNLVTLKCGSEPEINCRIQLRNVLPQWFCKQKLASRTGLWDGRVHGRAGDGVHAAEKCCPAKSPQEAVGPRIWALASWPATGVTAHEWEADSDSSHRPRHVPVTRWGDRSLRDDSRLLENPHTAQTNGGSQSNRDGLVPIFQSKLWAILNSPGCE